MKSVHKEDTPEAKDTAIRIDSPRSKLRGIIDPIIILFVLAYPEVELRGMRERDSITRGGISDEPPDGPDRREVRSGSQGSVGDQTLPGADSVIAA